MEATASRIFDVPDSVFVNEMLPRLNYFHYLCLMLSCQHFYGLLSKHVKHYSYPQIFDQYMALDPKAEPVLDYTALNTVQQLYRRSFLGITPKEMHTIECVYQLLFSENCAVSFRWPTTFPDLMTIFLKHRPPINKFPLLAEMPNNRVDMALLKKHSRAIEAEELLKMAVTRHDLDAAVFSELHDHLAFNDDVIEQFLKDKEYENPLLLSHQNNYTDLLMYLVARLASAETAEKAASILKVQHMGIPTELLLFYRFDPSFVLHFAKPIGKMMLLHAHKNVDHRLLRALLDKSGKPAALQNRNPTREEVLEWLKISICCRRSAKRISGFLDGWHTADWEAVTMALLAGYPDAVLYSMIELLPRNTPVDFASFTQANIFGAHNDYMFYERVHLQFECSPMIYTRILEKFHCGYSGLQIGSLNDDILSFLIEMNMIAMDVYPSLVLAMPKTMECLCSKYGLELLCHCVWEPIDVEAYKLYCSSSAPRRHPRRSRSFLGAIKRLLGRKH